MFGSKKTGSIQVKVSILSVKEGRIIYRECGARRRKLT